MKRISKGVWLDKGEIDKKANVQSRYEDEHYHSDASPTTTTTITTS